MIYIYDGTTITELVQYENQQYSIIIKKNKYYLKQSTYQLIVYNNNTVLKCKELPKELQTIQFCYHNDGQNGGGSDGSDIKNLISNKIPEKETTIDEVNKIIKEKEKEYSNEKKQNLKNEIDKLKEDINKNELELQKFYEKVIEYNGTDISKNEIEYYKTKLNQLNNKLTNNQNVILKSNRKVYGIIVNLTLYPGDNPSIMDKQKYKCNKSFDDLKKDYCDVFGIGCQEKNKSGGNNLNYVNNKSKSIKNVNKNMNMNRNKNYTMKNF
jgi:hypothetical protein